MIAMLGGQGYAVKAGMLVARGASVLMMDADGATRVSDLAKLQEAMGKLSPQSGLASPACSIMALGPECFASATCKAACVPASQGQWSY